MRWLITLGLCLGLLGCDDSTPLPERYEAQAATAAPALSPLCPELEAPPSTERLWVVFGSVTCHYCKDWLRVLEEEQAVLHERGITVVYYVSGAESCQQARTSARHVAFSVGIGSSEQSEAWGRSPSPTTVFVREGKVIGRMVGASAREGIGQLARGLY